MTMCMRIFAKPCLFLSLRKGGGLCVAVPKVFSDPFDVQHAQT